MSTAADQSQLTQRLTRNTLIAINFLIAIKKLIAKNPRCNLFYLVIPRTAVTQQYTIDAPIRHWPIIGRPIIGA